MSLKWPGQAIPIRRGTSAFGPKADDWHRSQSVGWRIHPFDPIRPYTDDSYRVVCPSLLLRSVRGQFPSYRYLQRCRNRFPILSRRKEPPANKRYEASLIEPRIARGFREAYVSNVTVGGDGQFHFANAFFMEKLRLRWVVVLKMERARRVRAHCCPDMRNLGRSRSTAINGRPRQHRQHGLSDTLH
jgi:hypothetical protein